VSDGGYGLRPRRVVANTSNKQPRQPIRGGPPACVLGEGLTTLNRKKKAACYEILHKTSELEIV